MRYPRGQVPDRGWIVGDGSLPQVRGSRTVWAAVGTVVLHEANATPCDQVALRVEGAPSLAPDDVAGGPPRGGSMR